MELSVRQNLRQITLEQIQVGEVWGFHPECPYLKVSSYGNVFSTKINKLISIRKNKDGYCDCSVVLNGKKTSRLVHRLVAETFFPFVDSRFYEVNHIDGNKSNNTIFNLEWLTRQENLEHSKKLRLNTKNRKPVYKYTERDLLDMIELRALGFTVKEIGRSYGVNKTQITKILQRRNKTWKNH